MTQITLRLDIPSLQVEVIELLEKTSKQMTLASNARWFHNGAETKYREFQVQLEEQLRFVKNLELRIAIVSHSDHRRDSSRYEKCSGIESQLPEQIIRGYRQ